MTIKVNGQDYLTISTDNLTAEDAAGLGAEGFRVWKVSRPKGVVRRQQEDSVEAWQAFKSWGDALKARGNSQAEPAAPPIEFVPVEPTVVEVKEPSRPKRRAAKKGS